MWSFLLRRLAFGLIALIGVMVITFFLARFTGSPALLYLPDTATDDMIAAFNRLHGYDQPLIVQFGRYVVDSLSFNFGDSLSFGVPAIQPVLKYLPTTLLLSLYALVLAVVIAIPLGSLAAVYRFRAADRAITIFSLVCSAMPTFWIALMAILVFAVTLRWLPTSGAASPQAWVMPVAVLALRPIGNLIQVVRGAMADTLGAGFILAARARGFTAPRQVFVHGVRNASLPIITIAADSVRHVLNGGVLVGIVFAFPSVGYLLVQAVENRDFPVVQAGIFVIGAIVVALNFLVDLAYGYADPRVRVS